MYRQLSISILFVILLLLAHTARAGTDTTWLSRKGKVVDKESADVYRISLVKEGELYRVKDFYKINNQLRTSHLSSSADTDIRQGYCYFYDSLGMVTAEGTYKDNKKAATWVYYFKHSDRFSHVSHYNGTQRTDSLFYKTGVVKRVEIHEGGEMKEGYCFDASGKAIPYFVYQAKPMFVQDLPEYLRHHIRYPALSKRNLEQGRVVVRFTVDEDGDVVNAHIMQGVSSLLDEEALRVVNTMPKWIPGSMDGLPVPVFYTLPITFRLGN